MSTRLQGDSSWPAAPARRLIIALYCCSLAASIASHSSYGWELDTNVECLKAFRHAVMDAHNSLSNWDVSNFSGPPGFVCSLNGITCWNMAENRIMGLKLQGAGLAGDPFPAGLSKCTSLQALDLSHNHFSGPLPPDLCQRLPYLTTLDLSYNDFSGKIPVALKDCKYLETLKLQSNRLSGEIPSELATLPRLTVLDLSTNSLSGPIPSSFLQTPYFRFSSSAFAHNPQLCGPPLSSTCASSRSPRLPLGADIAISGAALLMFIILLFNIVVVFLLRVRSRRLSLKSPSAPSTSTVEMFDSHLRLSWKSLEQATSSFSHANILGVGGSSTVYKGKLLDGKMIAIKVMQAENATELWVDHDHVQKQFFTELQVLGKLRHRNLVKILGYCYNMQDTMAIILDYMPMGSLDALLHNHTSLPHTILGRNSQQLVQPSNSKLQARFRILLGIAEGLAYLHHEYDGKRCVIHGDLKPGNVLLDEQMEAHIADFGIARMVGATNTTSLVTPSQGRVLPDTHQWWSFGYTAPECAQQGMMSRKADVFSFGMIILEVMTGERPSSSKLEEGKTLADWVGGALASGDAVEGILAAALKDEGRNCRVDGDNIVAILKLGCRCTSYQPAARPEMQQVLTFLHDLAHKQDSICQLFANAVERHGHVYNEDEVWMLSRML